MVSRSREALQGVLECRGLGQAIAFDEALQEIECGAAVIDEESPSKHDDSRMMSAADANC
jgi:hypothetical protein